jgi:hypothetical protein
MIGAWQSTILRLIKLVEANPTKPTRNSFKERNKHAELVGNSTTGTSTILQNSDTRQPRSNFKYGDTTVTTGRETLRRLRLSFLGSYCRLILSNPHNSSRTDPNKGFCAKPRPTVSMAHMHGATTESFSSKFLTWWGD